MTLPPSDPDLIGTEYGPIGDGGDGFGKRYGLLAVVLGALIVGGFTVGFLMTLAIASVIILVLAAGAVVLGLLGELGQR